jgi:hypothetical protein
VTSIEDGLEHIDGLENIQKDLVSSEGVSLSEELSMTQSEIPSTLDEMTERLAFLERLT